MNYKIYWIAQMRFAAYVAGLQTKKESNFFNITENMSTPSLWDAIPVPHLQDTHSKVSLDSVIRYSLSYLQK